MLLRAVATAVSLATSPLSTAPATAEVLRVQAHLDGALAMMASRDLSGLTTTQQRNRAELTRRLRAYRDAGQFPINRDFPGRFVPYFRDQQTGVLCAVGFLLATTGEHDLIDEIVANDNHVRVPALASHVEFGRWLDEHGLLLEEAARIQPTYGPPIFEEPPPRVSPQTLETSAVLNTGLAVASLLVSPSLQPRVLPYAGLLAGAAAIVLGVQGLDHSRTTSLAVLNLGVGAAGMVVASRALTLRARQLAPPRLSVTPLVDARRGARPAPGLAFRLRF